jgi:hypothetical protein
VWGTGATQGALTSPHPSLRPPTGADRPLAALLGKTTAARELAAVNCRLDFPGYTRNSYVGIPTFLFLKKKCRWACAPAGRDH